MVDEGAMLSRSSLYTLMCRAHQLGAWTPNRPPCGRESLVRRRLQKTPRGHQRNIHRPF